MATNEILTFASTTTGTNLLTQSEYTADAQRDIGHQPGIARLKLENKVLRQTSLLSAGLAEFIADYQINDVNDSLTPQNIADYLLDAIINTVMPAGTVIYVAQTIAPDGFLKANGAAISRTTYSRLFSKISTTFGVGDGVTTFNLPDLRGEFLRCLDDGRGIDPSRVMGTWQKGSLNAIDGAVKAVWTISASGDSPGTLTQQAGLDDYDVNNYVGVSNSSVENKTSVGLKGNSEGWSGTTRPRNIALLACIKF